MTRKERNGERGGGVGGVGPVRGGGGVREIDTPADEAAKQRVLAHVRAGGDLLGHSSAGSDRRAVRRVMGATYTPRAIVDAMLDWAAGQTAAPARRRSGRGISRFRGSGHTVPVGQADRRRNRSARALLLRANAVLGFADRLEVRVEDYRATSLPAIDGPTLFVGNPSLRAPSRYRRAVEGLVSGRPRRAAWKVSKLAGLHVHFFLQTLLLAQPGDLGTFVTAAEWLDVNYGHVLRGLLADGLGGESLHVLDPAALPFEDATTTAAISCFRVGKRSAGTARARRSLGSRSRRPLRRPDGAVGGPLSSRRWSSFVRGTAVPPADHVELGELFRVHRGQVTGCNRVRIEGPHSPAVPRRFLYPAVTRARSCWAAARRSPKTGRSAGSSIFRKTWRSWPAANVRRCAAFLEGACAARMRPTSPGIAGPGGR